MTEAAPFPAPPRRFADGLVAPVTVKRALKVCAIVGTLLTLINHGDAIAAGAWPPAWKILLTYLVPYSVSSYSTAALMADRARATSQHLAKA